jgi:AraC-like DNA-binding protein
LLFWAGNWKFHLKLKDGPPPRIDTSKNSRAAARPSPTIEDIADALHVSPRTLPRRSQDAGSSFQRVLEEARHRLARHYFNSSVLELVS